MEIFARSKLIQKYHEDLNKTFWGITKCKYFWTIFFSSLYGIKNELVTWWIVDCLVILTLRACMGIVVICLVALIILNIVHYVRRNSRTEDHFLHARTMFYLLCGKLLLVISVVKCFALGSSPNFVSNIKGIWANQ